MNPFYSHAGVDLVHGDCRAVLPTLAAESVNCVVTSPPYWGLRDYGVDGQVGLEKTAQLFVDELVAIFREVRRVLRSDGTLWLNLGDSYAGSPGGAQGLRGERCSRTHTARIDVEKKGGDLKPKDLVGIPWMVAFALRADGWFLRSDIIWSKPNPIPESVVDRPTKSHEYLFLLTKSARYAYDADAVRSPLSAKTHSTFGSMRRDGGGGRLVKSANFTRDIPQRKPRLTKQGAEVGANLRTVWTIPSKPLDEPHFAAFPPDLAKPCVLAGCPSGGLVLDPFAGAGTTLLVAKELGRRALGIELKKEYCAIAARRVRQDVLFGATA